jgi:hypothetical protein
MDAKTNQRRWNERYAYKKCFTTIDPDGYKKASVLGCMYPAHRVIWLMIHGRFPLDMIDHINGNPGDNRLENLREVDRWENAKNQKLAKNNASGVIGVEYWHSAKRSKQWVARISVQGKRIFLGYFGTFEEAVAARKAAEIEHGYHKNHGRKRLLTPDLICFKNGL